MAEGTGRDFEQLLQFLKQSRGFDFTAYKRSTLERRVAKRMQVVHTESFEDYVKFLEKHDDEYPLLFNTILINVTSFFRDPDAWKYIAEHVIPQIVERKRPDEPIRIWSAGCASGEEAYTIAILLAEHMGIEAFRERVKIYATDVDEEALNHSRSATYTTKDVEEVPAELLAKYFESNSRVLLFDRDIRRSVIFGRHDLVQDAPISRVDLLICRNTLMYFNAPAQERILSRFYFAIAEGGFLFLGKAETLLSNNASYIPIEAKLHVFSKAPRGFRREHIPHMRSAAELSSGLLDSHVKLREAVLDQAPIAQIATDAAGRLYLCNEKARKLFGLTQRDVGRPIQDLEISFRPVELRSGIEQAISQRRVIEYKEANWLNSLGENVVLDVKISPAFDDTAKLQGVVMSWEDVTHFRRLQDELMNFNQELETAYEELQSTNEELQTTNEELQSTVEELETTNEELQSTNEELETMNEELQSTNEELETMNDELQVRGHELNETNVLLNAILTGFQEGVIVLDVEMRVLAWNVKSEDLWGLRSEEVVGKHLLNLDGGLPAEQIRPLVKAVLAGKNGSQSAKIRATNRRGKEFECTVNVMPLSRSNGEVRGAIVVTAVKPLEEEVPRSKAARH